MNPAAIAPRFVLPEQGEALISAMQFAAALNDGDSAFFVRKKTDPRFPKPVEQGSRRTRYRLSDARRYIASLGEVVAG